MLSHLPGHLGEYLALTGARFNRKELVAIGLATHFVPSGSQADEYFETHGLATNWHWVGRYSFMSRLTI